MRDDAALTVRSSYHHYMKLGLREANQQCSKAIKVSDALETMLQEMADEGLITLPARKGQTPAPRWRPVRINAKPLSQTIIDERH